MEKKDMTEGVHEARNSMMQIMTLKGALWLKSNSKEGHN